MHGCHDGHIGTKVAILTDHDLRIILAGKIEIDEVVSRLVSLRVKAIINFSDGVPRKRSSVVVHQVDLAKIVSEIIYNFKTKEIDSLN